MIIINPLTKSYELNNQGFSIAHLCIHSIFHELYDVFKLIIRILVGVSQYSQTFGGSLLLRSVNMQCTLFINIFSRARTMYENWIHHSVLKRNTGNARLSCLASPLNAGDTSPRRTRRHWSWPEAHLWTWRKENGSVHTSHLWINGAVGCVGT